MSLKRFQVTQKMLRTNHHEHSLKPETVHVLKRLSRRRERRTQRRELRNRLNEPE